VVVQGWLSGGPGWLNCGLGVAWQWQKGSVVVRGWLDDGPRWLDGGLGVAQ